jgi:hypothetical protein
MLNYRNLGLIFFNTNNCIQSVMARERELYVVDFESQLFRNQQATRSRSLDIISIDTSEIEAANLRMRMLRAQLSATSILYFHCRTNRHSGIYKI